VTPRSAGPSRGSRCQIRPATADDAAEIARIYNQGIEERTSTFETQARDPDQIALRLEGPESPPVLVAEQDGRVVGWAGISPYSERDCYAGIGEASMYVDRAARGRGLGVRLGEALGREATRRGYWKIIGLLLADNARSIGVAKAAGARVVGTFHAHARLEGRWRDVVIIELPLPRTP
jgi:phosphinothricin acetyltransferase